VEEDMGAAPEEAIIRFLKRRYASAIDCGDDRTATRLRAELDRLMNGRAAEAGQAVTPELPPAA
jgi:hypothetical protein